MPSPRTSDTNGAGHHGDGGMDLRTAVAEIPLLPTPAAQEPGGTPEQYHARLAAHDVRDVRESTFLPRAVDASGVRGVTPNRSDESNGRAGETLSDVGMDGRWGDYEPAIRRWEHVLGRPAPEPTKPNAKGNPKLSDEFDEFLMGYPAGWITDVPGVTWNEALKACGDGVVPQQGAAAVRWLLAMGRASSEVAA